MGPSPDLLYAFRVLFGDVWCDLVSILPPETGFAIGLPEKAIVGGLGDPARPLRGGDDDPADLSPANFAENPVFKSLYFDVVSRLALEDPGIHAEARQYGKHYVYVMDSRTPTPDGAVPAEDIIGCFEVRDGSVVRDPFIPSSKYRLFGKHGFFTLSDTLRHRLLEEVVRDQTDLFASPPMIYGARAFSSRPHW